MEIGFSGSIPPRPVLQPTGPQPGTPSGKTAPSGGPPPLFEGEALSVREADSGPGAVRDAEAEALAGEEAPDRNDRLGRFVGTVLDLAPPEMPNFI